MAQQVLDTVGATDSLKTGGNKINANFTELYGDISTINANPTIAAISSSIPSLAFVDVARFDNGNNRAWLDKCEDKSWYNETTYTGVQFVQAGYANDAAALAANPTIVANDIYYNTASGQFVLYSTGTTIYRAGSQRFPMRYFVTVEATREIIWDSTGASPTMWMVITGLSNVTGVAAAGNNICISSTTWGLIVQDFVKARPASYRSAAANGGYGGLLQSGSWFGAGFSAFDKSLPVTVSDLANDVAITYLPDAPIDSATGMRVPTIIVGTAVTGAFNGSVVTDTGAVWDFGDGGTAIKVSIDEDSIYWETSSWAYVGSIPTADVSGASAYRLAMRSSSSAPAGAAKLVGGITDSAISKVAQYYGGTSGLSIYKENPSTPANGMVAQITNTWNGGWWVGDIRRAYLCNSKTADRSVKAGTLVENGTVTETVNAGGINTYSGFTTANYFSEAYSADLDFGTGDWSYAFWVSITTAAGQSIIDKTGTNYTLIRQATGKIKAEWPTGSISANIITGTGWHQYVVVKYASVVYLYEDGKLVGSAAHTLDVNTAAGALSIGGVGESWPAFMGGALALVRTGATAPTAEQIKFMYATEKPLFEAGAQCLLSNSASVSALSHDASTDVLSVGNGTNVDQFKGLKRLSSAAHGVTTLTALASGSGDKVVVGTGGSFNRPAQDVNSELKAVQLELAEAKAGSELYSFTSSGTTWNLPAGFKAVGPIWNITDGTFAAVAQGYDGFIWQLTGLTTAKVHNVTIRRV